MLSGEDAGGVPPVDVALGDVVPGDGVVAGAVPVLGMVLLVVPVLGIVLVPVTGAVLLPADAGAVGVEPGLLSCC